MPFYCEHKIEYSPERSEDRRKHREKLIAKGVFKDGTKMMSLMYRFDSQWRGLDNVKFS